MSGCSWAKAEQKQMLSGSLNEQDKIKCLLKDLIQNIAKKIWLYATED